MEQFVKKKRGAGTDIFSDSSHRMPQRPPAIKSGEGRGFEDFGSSFDPPKLPVTYEKLSKGKFKPATTLPTKARKLPYRIVEGESDDEILLSSQNSVGGDATSPSEHLAKGKDTEALLDNVEIVRVNGRLIAAHPDFKPSSRDAVKKLRFTKIKQNVPANDAVPEVPPSSSSVIDSQELLKPISNDIELLDVSSPRGSSSSKQNPPETSSARQGGPSVTCTAAHLFVDARNSSTSKLSSSTTNHPPPAKPRPRPPIVIKSTPQKRDSSPEYTPRAVLKRDLPLCNKIPEHNPNRDRKLTAKKATLPSSSRREPQEFPLSLQAKENVSDSARSGDTSSSKTKQAVISRATTSAHNPIPIPLPSPLKFKRKPISREITFPNLSPLSSSNDKGKVREKTPDGDDTDLTNVLGKRNGPTPFPMSSQMLAGIDRRLKSPSIHATKRASSDDSSAEQGRIAKKLKDTRSGVLDAFDYLHEPMEDDSVELGYARDPSKICPYCDEDLPSHPTPLLRHLLVTARRKSVSDPRPRNQGGLKAPLTVYISVCQRHRFESHQLPIATEKGWPKTIDFTKVPARVKKMKKPLEAIILDKDDINDTKGLDANGGSKGPRSKSVFWREVKREVKKQGSRTVVGVKGQFASFEKAQPGYYGEQGSVIIHQTLFDLFPPSTFDASLIAPLAPAEFIQRILVPEAAVRLIAQDLCVDIEDAIVTLRESAQYGVAMFPDTSESRRKGVGVDDDEMGVADRIVMERARVRRKELAEEEKVEEEILEEERAAQRAKARESRRKRALERAQQRETKARAEGERDADASEMWEASATRRTRSQPSVTRDSESDAMSVDSLMSRRSVRNGKKGIRSDKGKAVRATLQVIDSDSDSVELVGDSAHVARDKTRERSTYPDTHIGMESDVVCSRKKSFSEFALLDSDEEHEGTPKNTGPTAAGGSVARKLPLQIARNKSSAPAARDDDGWTHSLRTAMPDDTDSDMSNASRRLVRPAMKKGAGELPWLFSDPSLSDSS